jgi:hypothetical protein
MLEGSLGQIERIKPTFSKLHLIDGNVGRGFMKESFNYAYKEKIETKGFVYVHLQF